MWICRIDITIWIRNEYLYTLGMTKDSSQYQRMIAYVLRNLNHKINVRVAIASEVNKSLRVTVFYALINLVMEPWQAH